MQRLAQSRVPGKQPGKRRRREEERRRAGDKAALERELKRRNVSMDALLAAQAAADRAQCVALRRVDGYLVLRL